MFEGILGHRIILEKLKKTLENDTPSHAYVFYGKEGIGKRLVANEFSKGLLNTTNLENNMDFKYITRIEDKQNILVEQVRDEIISDVYTAPATGKYKVYVMDQADKMNESAQNALLKTLEEPPKSVVIILITSNINGLLGTILSRTTNIFFEQLSDNEVEEYIRKNELSIDKQLIDFSQGSISTLVDISKEENKQKIYNVSNLFESIKSGNKFEVIDMLKDISLKDELIMEYIEFLMLKNSMYDKISLIENTRRAVLNNANEDMQKTKLVIELLKK